jgi:hypothetical protein
MLNYHEDTTRYSGLKPELDYLQGNKDYVAELTLEKENFWCLDDHWVTIKRF